MNSEVQRILGANRKLSLRAAPAVSVAVLTPEVLTEEEQEVLKGPVSLPSPYLSPSQIEMYLRCPKQYEFVYVNKRRKAPALALEEGSAHHDALELNNAHKAKSGNDLPVREVVEKFAGSFSDRAKEIEDWEGETKDSVIQRGKRIVTNYMGGFAPRLLPEKVEMEVKVPVGPVDVFGYIDVQGQLTSVVRGTKTYVVADYKTVGKAKSEDELAGSVQLSFYSYAVQKILGKTLGSFETGFVNLLKTKVPEVRWQATVVDAGRVAWFRRIVLEIANAISRGSFPVTSPSSWACSSRFCGFWSECRGKYNR